MNQAARTRFQARRYKRHTRVILDGAMLQWIGWWGYCGYLFRHRERHGVGGAHLVPVSFYCTFHLLSPLPFPPSFHLCPQVGWATAGCVHDGSRKRCKGKFRVLQIVFWTFGSSNSICSHSTFQKSPKFAYLFQWTLNIDINPDIFLF